MNKLSNKSNKEININNSIRKHHYPFVLKIFFLFIIIFLIIISFYKIPKENTFIILQTSDLHSHFNFEIDLNGGYLKLSSVLKKEVENAGGKKNCLIIDCGDTFQGTVSGTITKGIIPIEIMNHFQYDVFVPGNHDFDFSTDNLVKRIEEFNGDVLSANLHIDTSLLSWKSYNFIDRNIVVIGMTSPNLDYWLWG